MTFSTAAETLLTGDKGKAYTLDHRQCAPKLMKLMEKVGREATTITEVYQYMTVALIRLNLSPSLKSYVDLKGNFSIREYHEILNEWETTQPEENTYFKKQTIVPGSTPSKPPFVRKPLPCFFCGKLGHVSKEC